MAGALAAEGLPCPAAPQKADCVHAQTQTEAAAEDRDPAQPGGGVPQRPGAGNHGPPPPILRDHLRVADCETYREQASGGRHGWSAREPQAGLARACPAGNEFGRSRAAAAATGCPPHFHRLPTRARTLTH